MASWNQRRQHIGDGARIKGAAETRGIDNEPGRVVPADEDNGSVR